MVSEQIKEILIKNNLDNYIDVFEKNRLLDYQVLQTMTNEDYLSIGVTVIGDRKKLLMLFSAEKQESIKNQKEEKKEEEWIVTKRNGRIFHCRSNDLDKLYCPKCHERVSEIASLCSSCNHDLVERIPEVKKDVNILLQPLSEPSSQKRVSSKSRAAAALLCFFFGGLSIHRFYVGKIGSALLQIILNCLFVGLIWVLIDFIVILCGSFEDGDGNKIENWG